MKHLNVRSVNDRGQLQECTVSGQRHILRGARAQRPPSRKDPLSLCSSCAWPSTHSPLGPGRAKLRVSKFKLTHFRLKSLVIMENTKIPRPIVESCHLEINILKREKGASISGLPLGEEVWSDVGEMGGGHLGKSTAGWGR